MTREVWDFLVRVSNRRSTIIALVTGCAFACLQATRNASSSGQMVGQAIGFLIGYTIAIFILAAICAVPGWIFGRGYRVAPLYAGFVFSTFFGCVFKYMLEPYLVHSTLGGPIKGISLIFVWISSALMIFAFLMSLLPERWHRGIGIAAGVFALFGTLVQGSTTILVPRGELAANLFSEESSFAVRAVAGEAVGVEMLAQDMLKFPPAKKK